MTKPYLGLIIFLAANEYSTSAHAGFIPSRMALDSDTQFGHSMNIKKSVILALAASVAIGASAAGGDARPNKAQLDQALRHVAAEVNASIASAPPQKTFIRLTRAVSRPGQQLFLLYAIPSVAQGNPQNESPRRVAELDGIVRPIALRNICQGDLNRRLMRDGATFVPVFLAANGDVLHSTSIVEADCSK